jgi:hypothetical protein
MFNLEIIVTLVFAFFITFVIASGFWYVVTNLYNDPEYYMLRYKDFSRSNLTYLKTKIKEDDDLYSSLSLLIEEYSQINSESQARKVFAKTNKLKDILEDRLIIQGN